MPAPTFAMFAVTDTNLDALLAMTDDEIETAECAAMIARNAGCYAGYDAGHAAGDYDADC